MVEGYLLHPNNVIIVSFVWLLLGAVRSLFPNTMAHPMIVRFLPLFPIGLCLIAVFLPGTVGHVDGVANRIMLGVVLGAMAANGHKIFNQTFLGLDRRIQK